MPRPPLSLAMALVTLVACAPELPTGPPALPAVTARGNLRAAERIGQGNCGELDRFPFVTATGASAGWVTTYWDDYSLYGVFEAAPGYRFVRTTFGVIEWMGDVGNIPIASNGRVDFERFILQSRNDPPAAVVSHRVPMDLINEELMEYAIFPRAVLQREGQTLPPLWAGEPIPWDESMDTVARFSPIYMIPNCRPRVTVLADLNMLDNDGLPGNMVLAGQFLWAIDEPWSKRWDAPRPDPSGGVLFDRGRESPCLRDGACGDRALGGLRSLYASIAAGGISDIYSKAGTLTTIPAGIRLLYLWLPRQVFTVAEINTLKQFLANGGRIVFIADRPDYYGAAGTRTLNQFLADMGSTAASAPGAFDCGGYRDLPLGDLAPHRVTQGASSVRVRCTGALTVGLRDFILFRDAAGQHVTGASVSVNTVPITVHQPAGF